MDRRAYYAWELPEEIVEAIRNAKMSPEAEALNVLLEPDTHFPVLEQDKSKLS